VEPLPAASRLLECHGKVERKKYEPVIYGEFLKRKVGSNFADGKGRYDD
jgi:hypothetical protein